MNKFKRFFATIVAGILSFPYLLIAQDSGTYIDDLGVQDSSYLEEPLILNETQNSGSGTTVIIIIVVVIVIAAVGFLAMKKKKK